MDHLFCMLISNHVPSFTSYLFNLFPLPLSHSIFMLDFRMLLSTFINLNVNIYMDLCFRHIFLSQQVDIHLIFFHSLVIDL